MIVPNIVGFAVWSPSLDVIGNSVRGVMFAEELVKIYNFHTFESVGDQVSEKRIQKYRIMKTKVKSLSSSYLLLVTGPN